MIYIISNTPYPNGWASTNRIKCYAKALSIEDVACKQLVFRPTEVKGKDRGNYKQGVDEGVPYLHIGPLYKPNISLIRKFYDVWSLICLYWYLLIHLKKDDTAFFYHEPFAFLKLFVRLVHFKKAKYMVELCEYPNCAIDIETEKTIAKGQRIINEYFPLYDGVIAISEELLNLAKTHVNNKCKLIKIPILVEFDKKKAKDLSDKTPEKFIFHSGSITQKKDGFLGMLEAFAQALPDLNTRLNFVSTGDYTKSIIKEDIDRILDKYGIRDRVRFTGYLSDKDLIANLQKATLVIINKYRTKQNKYCFSTKLSEYLTAGKPVIITNYGEAMNWLEDRKNAYIVEPEDAKQLADAIVEAINNPQERMKIAHNGLELCKKSFDYKQYSDTLKKFFCNK